MSRDSVRYGRQPKRAREADGEDDVPEIPKKVTPAPEPAPAPAPAPVVEAAAVPIAHAPVPTTSTSALVNLITTAHIAYNAYNDDFRANLVMHPISLDLKPANDAYTDNLLTDPRSLLMRGMAALMTPTAAQIVEFAKKLPGFLTLPQDDQVILIKNSFFELWLTRASRLSTSNAIVFDEGSVVTKEQLCLVYEPPFAMTMLSYIWSLLKLNLSSEEIATFFSVMVMCPKHENLVDPQKVYSLHCGLNNAFRQTVLSSGPNGEARLAALISAANEARIIGKQHHALIAWCRIFWDRLSLPALFSEIFDIPKSKEEEIAAREAAMAAAAAAAAAATAGPSMSSAMCMGPATVTSTTPDFAEPSTSAALPSSQV